jgi:hypothetical protein
MDFEMSNSVTQAMTPPLDSPYRRRRIRQLAHNEFPGCTIEFIARGDDGISFQIKSKNGRLRSGAISLLPHHGHIRLNRRWLKQQLKTG